MSTSSYIQTLDAHAGVMPLSWCFKDRLPNGAYIELLLRRVKTGQEEACADTLESGFGTHLKGKYSDATTFNDRLHDGAIADEQILWVARAIDPLLRQMATLATHQPALLKLFAQKGKIEIYGSHMPYCHPQYISGNHTIKIHLRDVNDSAWTHGLTHLLAQHLDYPVGAGERRFSTSRLFDLCFASEKVLVPHGLSAAIDAHLLGRGIYQPDRHLHSEKDHVGDLLSGKPSAVTTSYERVLQRERFATMVSWWACADAGQRYPSPILAHYHQLIALDLAAHTQRDYLGYPPKHLDAVAEAIHQPLSMIFNKQAGAHDARRRSNLA